MSAVYRAAVAARRIVGRHPWIHWLAVGTLAAASMAGVLDYTDRVDAARDSWGDTRTVWIAVDEVGPGAAVDARSQDLPVAVLPDRPVDSVDGLIARQRIGRGEIVTETDVADDVGRGALVPAGWLAVPIVESPRLGADVGDRVQVAADGFIVSADALVVALDDDVTLVAVPADQAPTLAAAAHAGVATLLLDP
jgi:hypothetical protein